MSNFKLTVPGQCLRNTTSHVVNNAPLVNSVSQERHRSKLKFDQSKPVGGGGGWGFLCSIDNLKDFNVDMFAQLRLVTIQISDWNDLRRATQSIFYIPIPHFDV